jgi:U32 family peptidase
MIRPELLAPAGDLEKLKIALIYGADAVYLGGTMFSLRARASKFTLPMIAEGVAFAHERGKKIYVTTNMVPHNEDLPGLEDYLKELEAIGVDALICSSPVVINAAKRVTKLPIHLSTQHSVANSAFVRFWSEQGVSRVVLARELTALEIAEVAKKTTTELEVFIHGGMCVSYSGRCTMSNSMTGRDANRGGCAHSCRWNYHLFHEGEMTSPLPDFQMSAKDLATLEWIPALMSAGVASLKIEGRMKSVHYIAMVVKAYRRRIDDVLFHNEQPLSTYQIDLEKAENRSTFQGFLGGDPGREGQLYGVRSERANQEFVGLIESYDALRGIAFVEQRNHFRPGDRLELISPREPNFVFEVTSIHDREGNPLDAARHAMQKIVLPIPKPCAPYDILRMC